MADEPVGAKARKEQVNAAPRPTQLGAGFEEIAENVRRVRDTADTWKVYRKEWIPVYHGQSAEDVREFYAGKYAGRVQDDDVRLVNTADQVPLGDLSTYASDPVTLELRVWNQRGEWKHKPLAETHAAEFDGDVKIVGRNSREEMLLKDYSVKKLVTVTGQAREQG